jgi:chemotaxis protein CheC
MGMHGQGENRLKLGLLEQSAVREIANIGLGHATTAIANMTGKGFNMSVPDAESLSLEEIPYRLGGVEQLSAGIYMPVVGDASGYIACLMPWESAQALWRCLIGAAPEDITGVGELEASVLMEVGNIINGSFLTAISDMTSLMLEATPPQLSVDMSAAILSSIVLEASIEDHIALAVRTVIASDAGDIAGFFLFIPTYEALQLVFSRLGLSEAA